MSPGGFTPAKQTFCSSPWSEVTRNHNCGSRVYPVTKLFSVFFFQAEDGIRDLTVTGVQTCALPIYLGAIWLTHAHIDHIMGVGAVRRATGAPIHLHPLDRPIYDALPQFGAWVGMQLEPPPPPDVALQAGIPVRIGRFEFDVRFTPGHSPGSVSFVGHDMVFGGDVLFN